MIMRHLTSLLVLWVWAWSASGSRTKRDVVCMEGAGYTYSGICCLNCPAGTFVKEACSTAYERGLCSPCDFDTYTEHDNGLYMCLMCTKCRPDQEIVEQCNSTRNTRCQCKAGSYCRPDQACEVCKTCRKYVDSHSRLCTECGFRCKEDEEMVRSCTAHSNTVCQERGSTSAIQVTAAVAVSVVGFVILIVIIGCFLFCRTSPVYRKAVISRWLRGNCIENSSDLVEAKQNSENGTREEEAQIQPFLFQTLPVGQDMVEDEEDKGLGPSLPNTTASSQTSLPAFALTSEYCLSRSLPQQLNTPEIEKLRRLVPLNGDDSLKKSFDLFGEIDVKFHNRFFRLIGLSDNAIRTAEVSWPLHEDRVYELLRTWMEKEGMKADFMCLIKALFLLNQRLSAENIIARAIDGGYFQYEDD